MDTESLVVALESAGYTFAFDADTQKITHRWTGDTPPPAECKPLLRQLRDQRDAVAALLDRWRRVQPHLSGDTLVIPFDAHPRYHWWDERDESNLPLTVCAILTELDAPARLHRSYCGTCARAGLRVVDEPAVSGLEAPAVRAGDEVVILERTGS